jgi:hypothetical protein
MIILFNYSCGFCNHVFPSSHLLSLHKEDTKHWSDDGFEEVTESEETESEETESEETESDHDNKTHELEETERLL